MKKKILILGVTGQDGSYMADFLLKKNYMVHGLIRKSATGNTKNINHIIKDSKIFNKSFFIEKGDLLDPISIPQPKLTMAKLLLILKTLEQHLKLL